MTTNRASHVHCSHAKTPADRAACRKFRAVRAAKREELLIAAAAKALSYQDAGHWVFYGARAFGDYTGDDLYIAAGTVLSHFMPTGDKAKDDNRRRNGWTVTDDVHEMLRVILRRAS